MGKGTRTGGSKKGWEGKGTNELRCVTYMYKLTTINVIILYGNYVLIKKKKNWEI